MVNGVNRFDPAQVADAHAVVAQDALTALRAGQSVVVANTHVRLWDMAAVVGAARLYGRTMRFVQCRGARPRVHRLSASMIAPMRHRWQALPAEFEAVSCYQYEARAR